MREAPKKGCEATATPLFLKGGMGESFFSREKKIAPIIMRKALKLFVLYLCVFLK